jgi:hypothetical protein
MRKSKNLQKGRNRPCLKCRKSAAEAVAAAPTPKGRNMTTPHTLPRILTFKFYVLQ